MKLILGSLLMGLSLAALPQTDYTTREFSAFMSRHGKQYETSAEYNLRLSIFRENLAKIEDHNQSGASWKMDINQFADLTHEEFQALYMGGYKRTPGSGSLSVTKVAKATKTRDQLPDSVDWREKGAVTAPKNQGMCGSCWAFATTEQIESYAAINSPNNQLIELSAEQVTSCAPNPQNCGGSGGCQGSICQLGYSHIQLFGHVSEADYPYTQGGSCKYDFTNKKPVVGITGYENLPPNDQDAVMQHLAEVGPLAVAVYASNWSFYSGGVYSGCHYDSNIAINHAVQLVGYGSDPSEGDYWIVRNSWGEGWGKDGYILLQRDATAKCATNASPMDGTACQGGPGNDEQHVCGQCGILFDVNYPLGAKEFSLP